MNEPSYIEREVANALNGAMFHSSECNDAYVRAFCDDTPDPGCTCGRVEAIHKMTGVTVK